jgi:hypothetical protein
MSVMNSRLFIQLPRRRGRWRYLPSAIGAAENGGSGCCQAPNTSLVPVYDRITFFGNSALRIS